MLFSASSKGKGSIEVLKIKPKMRYLVSSSSLSNINKKCDCSKLALRDPPLTEIGDTVSILAEQHDSCSFTYADVVQPADDSC